MKIITLASGSKGNTSYIEVGNTRFLIDIGITYRHLLERLEEIGKSIDDIEDGATVAIPNDPSNEARALNVLVSAGLIKVKDGELITVADITENPKNLQFKELEAAQLPRALDDIDIAVINGNYALDADLDVTKDALFVEDENSQEMKARRNVLAIKEGNESSEKIKDLIEVLTSDDVRTFIEKQYKGAVVPVF